MITIYIIELLFIKSFCICISYYAICCQDEYLNLETLERRLHILIKRFPANNHNQQLSHTNSSPPIGTMIPTPGFQQTGNSSFGGTSSVDSSFANNNSSNTVASSTVNSGSFFPTRNGSSGSGHGNSFGFSDGSSTLHPWIRIWLPL